MKKVVQNPIVELKNGEILVIYRYKITHVTQKKKRKLKDETTRVDVVETNRTTFPYDLEKILNIQPDEKERKQVYFYTLYNSNRIYVDWDEPTTDDVEKVKKVRLNKQKGLKNDYVDPKKSRRSKNIFLPKKIFRNATEDNNMVYVLNASTKEITCKTLKDIDNINKLVNQVS